MISADKIERPLSNLFFHTHRAQRRHLVFCFSPSHKFDHGSVFFFLSIPFTGYSISAVMFHLAVLHTLDTEDDGYVTMPELQQIFEQSYL